MGTTILARAAVNSGHAFSPETDLTDLEEVDAEVAEMLAGGNGSAHRAGTASGEAEEPDGRSR